MMRRHIVLLIAIRPSDGDVKPGGPLGSFREEQAMSRMGNARMGNERGAWKLLVGKPEGKRPVGSSGDFSVFAQLAAHAY